MNDSIQSLLEKAAEQDADSPDFTAWSHGVLAAFPVKAYDTLRSFKAERFDYPEGRGYRFQLEPDAALVAETISLIHHAWRAIGGEQTPDRGQCRAAIASIEFVYAQLSLVLWMGARLNIYRTHRPEAARQFVDNVLSIDWHDAEAVLRSNFQVLSCLGVADSAADNLYNWTVTIDRPKAGPKHLGQQFPDVPIEDPTPEETMSGAALLAVDAALASADRQHSIGLMSFAADAMWQAGYVSGWESREALLRDSAKQAGQKGGTQRHQASRELKLWALGQAVSLRGSDIEIARRLAPQIPAHLRDASADPERLIYEALRAARKNSRQGWQP